MNAEQFLKQLLEYERRVGRLYLTLGNHPSFSVDFRSFWHRMAEDERHHAVVLERSQHLIDLQKVALQISDSVFHAIEKQLLTAEEAVGNVRINADDALRYAIVLESSELNRLDEVWFRTFPPSISALLSLLTPEDNVHLRRLVEAVHAFSTNKALQEQATSLWVNYQRTKATQAAGPTQQQPRDVPQS